VWIPVVAALLLGVVFGGAAVGLVVRRWYVSQSTAAGPVTVVVSGAPAPEPEPPAPPAPAAPAAAVGGPSASAAVSAAASATEASPAKKAASRPAWKPPQRPKPTHEILE
jgi:hypothetical protein